MKAVCPLALIVGVAAMMSVYSRHPAADETDYHILPGPVGPWQDAVIHGQELEDQVKRVQERCHAKDAVVTDLIAGRLTLFEAAARFRNLNSSNPQAEQWLGYQYPDQPYELGLCRSIIHRVELELGSRASGQEDGIVARLETELAKHLQRHGRVCLTD
jgi:hypothetical protein